MHILSWLSVSSCLSEVISMTCGIDKSTVTHIYEGIAKIETYPWLGVLYYPYHKKRFTTAVVLVTRQIVLAAANEIDKLPKTDFRARAHVVLGQNCKGSYIGVRDYTYHPDYSKDTFSTLAMIQLEIDHVRRELRPICPPPSHFRDQNFFAMVLSDNCKKLKLEIHKMQYVSPEQCKSYYRRSELGFGVYGPGCQSPARFLDYGMYHEWVRRSVARIGRPAVTALADNHVVLRRKLSNVQRFGPCDHEETYNELYTDTVTMSMNVRGLMQYNVSIISKYEYSCVVFKAVAESFKKDLPKIRLRRWCSSPVDICSGFDFSDINIGIEVNFTTNVNFTVRAYGNPVEFLDPLKVYTYLKEYNKLSSLPEIVGFHDTREAFLKVKNTVNYPAFG